MRRLNKVVIAVLILIFLSLSAISQIPGKLVARKVYFINGQYSSSIYGDCKENFPGKLG